MRATALAVAIVLAAGTMNPTAVMAHTPLRWGYSVAPTALVVNDACVYSAGVWLQELESSGIVRLKARFELRSPNDPGIPGTSYLTRGWFYSGKFPDDARSYWARFSASFRYFSGIYKIRAIFVGERASFWRPDHKLKIDVAPELGCSILEFGS